MSNKTYDTIKTIALVAVPILAFLGSICAIWNIPHCEQVTATLTAIDSLLGALVIALSKAYHKSQGKPEDDKIDYVEESEGDEGVMI